MPLLPTPPSPGFFLHVPCRYDRHPCFTADVFIDIHAHSTSKSGFLFCNPVPEERSSPGLLERSVRLPKLLDAHMLGFRFGLGAQPSVTGSPCLGRWLRVGKGAECW